ncbi:NUCLEAR FACTOR KAPPA-B-BINDING-LIKE PROTEIN 1 [Hibiscus trionum]|uniref:NUCLEAR FACTOR KAPPA-B-BINDING-LIKE PROTEIN 1 n=1 Tax=Hibiscus trionum TaxID=183268 RepID=A0A9W7M217_HIBTR|nr:NUCLEAR FACTOR KAPPA-B-BINDING-LIKE PROTEIN 1 [Hibiscus trionum]
MNEAISSEAWGLPSRTVLILANCFADWFRISQESLQKIGSLPAPPLTLMHQTVNVTERLREVRPRKTVATISRCPEEIRDYFRKEEAVRYFVPERAFSYTTLDGRKSTVAPLRRCSGKPSLKCREHFMLRADRPPNITVLSLVRDAAARLPDRMGTRADVCVLVRDSQYIMEEISDEQLNQVVSGALDRLHYEHDPCVRFNAEKKLWFYLHGDREEDDFEYDATFSTKKQTRQR